MSLKTGAIPFQPAPRPQPRVSAEQTRELAEATRDLGFGRTTSTPESEVESQPASLPESNAPPEPRYAQPPTIAPLHIPKEAAAPTQERMATLKVAMPDEIWNALRHVALNRRVTVKYLVMEALAAKGYDIDLAKVAEDGRRLR